MLTLDQIFSRLQCCYISLISKKASNVDNAIFDKELDARIDRAYALLENKIYIQEVDYNNYVQAINEVCKDNLNCGCVDCEDDSIWIGIDPVCEVVGSTSTTGTTSTSTTTGTTSSTSTTTVFGQTSTTTTSTTQTTNTTSSTSTTTNAGIDVYSPPAWLASLAMSSSGSSRAVSLFVVAGPRLELKVEDLDGNYLSGLGWLTIPWDSNHWIAGTTDYADAYSEVFRLNGLTDSTGGLTQGKTYKFSLRVRDDNSVRYVRNITIPLASQSITPINIGVNSTSTSTTSTSNTTGTTNTSSSSSTTTSSGGLSPCLRGPNLINILSNTDKAVTFYFDGEDVFSIKWWIRDQATNTVQREGTVTPFNSTPTISFNSLPVAPYVLEIQGNSCSSSIVNNKKTFTVNEVIVPDTDGTITQTVAGRTIKIINGRVLKGSVVAGTGNIHLDYPETTSSTNGANSVFCTLMSEEMGEIKASTKNLLRSAEGAPLPFGDYRFFAYWRNLAIAPNYSDIPANFYQLFGNASGINSNSRDLEYCDIEIRPAATT